MALPLQIYNTHVHNGAKIGERLHHSHKRALIVAVNVELQQRVRSDRIFKSSGKGKKYVCHIQLRCDYIFTETTIQVSKVSELKAIEQPPLPVCQSHLYKLGVSQSGANEDYAVVQVGQTLSNRSLILTKERKKKTAYLHSNWLHVQQCLQTFMHQVPSQPRASISCV